MYSFLHKKLYHTVPLTTFLSPTLFFDWLIISSGKCQKNVMYMEVYVYEYVTQ